jgi:hypothetical protein
VSGQQPAHEAGEAACLPGAQKEMCMIVEQGPGKAIGAGLFQQMRETVKEELSVLIIEKDLSSFDAPDDDMLEKTWIVDASGSWHGGKRRRCAWQIQQLYCVPSNSFYYNGYIYNVVRRPTALNFGRLKRRQNGKKSLKIAAKHCLAPEVTQT